MGVLLILKIMKIMLTIEKLPKESFAMKSKDDVKYN